MTVTLNLAPEVEAQVSAQARAEGLALEDYLPTLITQAARERSPAPGPAEDDAEIAAFEADLDALAEGSEHWPPQPPGSFSRAAFYEERP